MYSLKLEREGWRVLTVLDGAGALRAATVEKPGLLEDHLAAR
jgi:hypothetical protein